VRTCQVTALADSGRCNAPNADDCVISRWKTDLERRDSIVSLASAMAARPLAARAQQKAMPVIGVLSTGSPSVSGSVMDAFRQGLREAGYVEGQNLAIEYCWAEGHYDRLPALAADLVRRKVDWPTQ
jgi:putative ABC transport system substrate-binding protein